MRCMSGNRIRSACKQRKDPMEPSSRLLIVGAGGHGCVVAETAFVTGRWSEIVFLDDVRPEPALESPHRVLGGVSDLPDLCVEGDQVIIAVGDNARRAALGEHLRTDGMEIATVIHPSAVVSPTARIGTGSVLMPGSIMNAGSVLGLDCILNTGSSIDHGVRLGNGVHVSPGVHVGGDVLIGDRSWIGIGASVTNGCRIGADVSVGAGAIVVDDLQEPGTYVGVPATQLRR